MTDIASLEARVGAFVAEQMPALARSREAVLAVSGGADSTAMVSLLCEAEIIEPGRSVVAHFDHRLRGTDASRRDRDAVAALSTRYRLAMVEGSWADPAPGEAATRRARYAFLSSVCHGAGIDAIVTGHTADDQVETVLMHALRGAGLRGLSGMDAESRVAETTAGPRRPKLLRPLLRVARAETRAYCDARGLPFADDATNDDLTFLRNRIRRDLLPALERRVPDIRCTLLQLADTSRRADDLLDRLAAPAILDAAAGCVTMSRPLLSALADPIAVHAYRLALEQLLGDAREFDRRHYKTMLSAAPARTGSRFQLPRHIELTVDPDTLSLSAGPLLACAIPPGFERMLPFHGVVGDWTIDVQPAARRSPSAGQSELMLQLPSGAVLRAWRRGDRIRLPGRGHKKLHDYYVDRKIPRRHRLAAPVIAHGTDVLWTPLAAAGRSFTAGACGQPWTVTWRAAGLAASPDCCLTEVASNRYVAP